MRPVNVLVVDDNADTATSLALLIEAMGHTVEVAHNGERAVELAMAYEPDLILLDLGLPDFNGYEVVQRLRGLSWAKRSAMIVAVTGWATEEHRQRAQQMGFDGYLVKPVTREAFRDLMRTASVRVVTERHRRTQD